MPRVVRREVVEGYIFVHVPSRMGTSTCSLHLQVRATEHLLSILLPDTLVLCFTIP